MTENASSPRLTRRNAWKILGMAGAMPFIGSEARAAVKAGSATANSPGAPPHASSSLPFHPPVIPKQERAGDGQTYPTGLIRLDGTKATLLLIARRTGLPEIAYWGKRLPDHLLAEDIFAARAPETPENGPDQWRPSITLLDTLGSWNFDMPGLVACRQDGTNWTAEFAITAIHRQPGTVTIDAQDEVCALGVSLRVSLDDQDVLTTQYALTNKGDTPLEVERFVSGTFLLPEQAGVFTVMHGAWTAEFGASTQPLVQGGLIIESRRNRSHDHFPALIATTAATTENEGEAWAVLLGWSGGHRLAAERMEDSRYRVSASEYLYPGEIILAAGETYRPAPSYAAFSPAGRTGIAQACQGFARRTLLRWPSGRMKPRPVLLNSWEGNGFALEESHLRSQIDAASRLGVERFVLDDGWFGARRSDRLGLGDWKAASTIFPNGLRPLSDHAHARGMEFGLWYEPEMVNPDSDLYRAHPDWVLHSRGRPLLTSRDQVVLDISRPEVSNWLFETISKQVTDWRIDYIKWDFNRDLLDASDSRGRAAYRAQVIAVYTLWDRLHAAHPTLEIESCASGGGRADWGAIAHTQRVWLSDNTSAVDRLRMQGQAWHFLPPEITGCHISASPNWLDKRETSLDFRAAIALFGHLGLELNPMHLTAEESERLRQWIILYKRLRSVLHAGLAQFGEDTPARVIRGVTSHDGRTGIFLIAQRDWPQVHLPALIRLPGLSDAIRYRLTLPAPQQLQARRPSDMQETLLDKGLEMEGAILNEVGLFLPKMPPQSAIIIECQGI